MSVLLDKVVGNYIYITESVETDTAGSRKPATMFVTADVIDEVGNTNTTYKLPKEKVPITSR